MACQELLNDKSITGESFIFLNKIICKDIEIQAKKYGQSVALAGDYLSNPNKFLKDIDKGLREANDPFNYGRLALKNSYHFHPEVILKWRKYHLQALSIARSLKKEDNYLNNIDIFEKALYTNAFADHYLYDSFASGHMGFNRPSSRPTTSKTHHDFWNYAGRFLKDGNNHIWYGMGDDYLNTERNKYGKEHLLLTAKESIINLLRTCITRQNYDREEMLFLNLPKAYLDPKVNKWLIDEDKKIFVYEEGWGDDRVRDEVNCNFSLSLVAGYRLKMFGRIREPKSDPNEGIRDRLMAHDDVLLKIHDRLDHIETMLNIEND